MWLSWRRKNHSISNSSDSIHVSAPVKTRLLELEAEAEEPTNHKAPN